MASLYNLARMTTATTGTGTITLGSAVGGFRTFAEAGATDGQTVSYGIRDGANSEVGRGVYTSSGTTLTRSVLISTNANSAINLSGAAEVFISALAEDLNAIEDQAARTAAMVANVKDYGAVGDGSTDDTTAIQAAIDSFGTGGVLATANGGILYFPPGLYKVTAGTLIEQTGVRVIGASQDATKIVVAANLGTAAVFEWDQTNSGYSQVGCGAENLRIDMAGYTGHGVWMHKAYDGVTLTNVYVDNVADAYNGFRLEEDSGVTDQISQTITMTNCIAIHQNATADEPLFYLQNVQEGLLQSCKAFGTYEANGKATCYPFELIDCRGIVMTKCSAAFADRHGIYIRTSTRVSSGITIVGTTFETIDGAILASGGVNGEVSNLRVINPRVEGTVAHANGAIDLNKVYRSHLETNSLTVNLDADCVRVVVESYDDTQVTDAGTQTTLIGFANGIHANYRVAPAIYSNNLIASNTGLKALDTDSSHVLAFVPGSNLSADRTLTLTTGDANRTLDLSAGSATISAYGATLIDDADAATARATLSVREVLTANRTYYVRTDGSDSNTGLVDSAGGAFLTIQKAIGTLYAIDLNGYNVTISLGTSVGGAISASGRFIGKGTITINGADSTAANHVLTSVYCSSGSALTFSHVQFTNPSWRALEVYSGAVVKLSTGCDFGAASNAQITVDGAGSQLYIAETYTISGGGTRHYNVNNNGYAVKEAGASYTITVSGTPAFSGQFAYTEAGGIISLYNTTFSGAATGQRHYVGMLSSINTFGGGASFFPGNSAGTVDAAKFGVFA